MAAEPCVSTDARDRLTPVQRWDSLSDFGESVSHTFVPLHLSARAPRDFHAATRGATMQDFKIVEISSDEHVVERTRRLIEQGDSEPSYKVSLMLEGSCFMCQDGRDVVLEPGDIAVYDTTHPYTLAFDANMQSIVTIFPKRLVELSDDRVAALTATALGRDDPLGAMVGSVLGQLAGRLDLVNATIGWRLARNAVDLVNILLRDSLGEERALPADRLLDRIYAYIDDHLADPGLSPAHIAEAHFISVRYLQVLFQHAGVPVSTYVRTRRLERCRTDLADPGLAGETLSTIASRWSFADLPHFSRTFKSAYGTTPSAFRATVFGQENVRTGLARE